MSHPNSTSIPRRQIRLVKFLPTRRTLGIARKVKFTGCVINPRTGKCTKGRTKPRKASARRRRIRSF